MECLLAPIQFNDHRIVNKFELTLFIRLEHTVLYCIDHKVQMINQSISDRLEHILYRYISPKMSHPGGAISPSQKTSASGENAALFNNARIQNVKYKIAIYLENRSFKNKQVRLSQELPNVRYSEQSHQIRPGVVVGVPPVATRSSW